MLITSFTKQISCHKPQDQDLRFGKYVSNYNYTITKIHKMTVTTQNSNVKQFSDMQVLTAHSTDTLYILCLQS